MSGEAEGDELRAKVRDLERELRELKHRVGALERAGRSERERLEK